MNKLSCLLAVTASMLCACATNTGDSSADARGRITNAAAKELWNGVVSFGTQYAANSLSGQKGQATADAAFKAAGAVFSADAFRRVLAAKADPAVAAKAAQLYEQANPQTPTEHSFVANVIGSGLQYVANQYFGSKGGVLSR